jgi:hypothetical protein
MHRRYTTRQREQLIEAVRSSGEPVKAVAERMGVSLSAAYLWMRAGKRPKSPPFARVVREPLTQKSSMIIDVGGVVIRVDAGFDAVLLREVIEALKGGLS